MLQGTTVKGSKVILNGKNGQNLPALRPANDNAPKDDVKTVTVRKTLTQSGVPIKIKVPVTEYVGVAVATTISDEGVLTSAIELIHTDSGLNYRVFEEEGNHAVVAEWQNWGKKLCLPLFIRAGNGDLVPYTQHVGGVLVGNQTNRRQFAPQANRRPRFLNKRKLGLVSG
ncbi:DUF6101 family protein [Maritalea porphyrae]|uniref:DUF6101 family protein n=1 Tax=Maritalea porphyrae TaxID=880732 RepID=UPI0022AEF754|nr:DUF6101 family protein [Maritalea porphyrae]MCZ4271415.1 DUF6101 family protein [Maritalea porphyrae]